MKRATPLETLRDERGSTIVLVAIAMTALLSAVALAVDVGMLYTGRTEAQRVADASALAGAHAFIDANTGQETLARANATEYALRNDVREQDIVLLPEDIDVDVPNETVTVRVRRTEDSNGAVMTWFARVFGVDEVGIVATATAKASPAGAATCLKPFTIPDAWDDDGNLKYDPGEYYDPSETGYGSEWRNGVPSDNGIDPEGTTYENDYGRPMVIKEGDPKDAKEYIAPGIYHPWVIPQPDGSPATGASDFRDNIASCNTSIVHLGEEYLQEPGKMDGPLRQGMRDLLATDDGASWDTSVDSVVGSAYQPWTASPRRIHLPLYDPNLAVDPGRDAFVFNAMTAFWVDELRGDDVIGRFLKLSGLGIGTDGTGGATVSEHLKYVHLVD